jgi:glycosyltransferase involved in cell wall biosynthesis
MPEIVNLKSQKTIVFVFHFTPYSIRTVEQFLLKLSKKLNIKGFKLVHCYTGEPSVEYINALSEMNIDYFVSEPIKSITDGITLGLKLKKYSPDILFTAYYSAFNLGIWALKFTSNSKDWIFNDRSSGESPERKGITKIIARLRGRIAGSLMKRIICVSNFVRLRDVNKVYLPANKATTIYNGIDLNKFMKQDGTGKVVASTEVTIVYVGQLIEEKGVDTLLRAAASLKVPYRLLIAGKGIYQDELKRLGSDLGVNVQWLGQINWTAELFSIADIAVFPSVWKEAFGFVIAEAMSCGTCVVASDAGGIPEVVGDAGIIFRANNYHELRNELEILISDYDERVRLSALAVLRVNKLFNIENMVNKYCDELSANNK